MRERKLLANAIAYFRPANEQSEKSTGTIILRIDGWRARMCEVDEVFISYFTDADA